MIITEKIISVLITTIQIIQFITANTHSAQIKHLQKMIKSNHSLIRHDQRSMLEFRLYTLVALVIIIKVITTFISLLIKTTNLTLIDHTSAQKTNQALSQRFRTEVYFSTLN